MCMVMRANQEVGMELGVVPGGKLSCICNVLYIMSLPRVGVHERDDRLSVSCIEQQILDSYGCSRGTANNSSCGAGRCIRRAKEILGTDQGNMVHLLESVA